MKKESPNNFQFSPEQLKQVLGSPEGKQLIALLSRDGGKTLKQAAAEFQKGNTSAAQELLKPVVETAEAEELLQKINNR